MEKYTNDLAQESSPYLLQHAHNPVNWVPWSDDVFERAEKEDKLVLISIGYSACHWCHVMEHESFEDEEVAALMNKLFINVKVDREERPDVDQVYMTAVQLMTQKGGWPLNCFTMPDGRPVYGGTYFPKEQWMHILKSLHHAYVNEHDKMLDYAANLHKGVVASELIEEPKANTSFEQSHIHELIRRWSKSFDHEHGGTSRAPKFPLPSNFEFLLDYALNEKDEVVQRYVELSLDKMALGGIYDQVGGGFARYSVDMLWKVPHFEKMLYDNGQLLTVYSNAYKSIEKPLYKRIVYQTIDWLEREMSTEYGAFSSALDADSEGVEGKFYIWTEAELDEILGSDAEWAKQFFSINQRGYWEGNYILLRESSDKEVCDKFGWTMDELEEKIFRINDLILSARKNRVRPGLDDKCLTSWNAMALRGLCDAYKTFGEESFKTLAYKNARWIVENQVRKDGGLWRSFKNGSTSIEAFLEDYAHVISAFIAVYEVSLDEQWLERANRLMKYTLDHFFDQQSGMFFFTSSDTRLIARKMELNDNVIPSSNSVMARNLLYLSKYFRNEDYARKSEQMLANVYDGMEMYGSGYSNWALLLNHFVYGLYEVVIIGEDTSVIKEVLKAGIQKTVVAQTQDTKNIQLPIFEEKKNESKTMLYVCTDGTCLLPTTDVEEALNLMR